MPKNAILLLMVLTFVSVSIHAQVRIKSTAAGGNWGTPATWVGGVVPASNDTVEIVSGSSVTLASAGGNTAGRIEISGALGFASTGVSLTANGSLIINSSGVFNPYYSGAGKPVTVKGNFTNNGQADLSKGGFNLIMSQAGTATSINGSGTYTTGVIRSLTIDNSNGVNLSVALSVSYTLALTNGLLTNGTNLTVDDKSYGNGTTVPYCIIQRSQSSSLNSTYTLGATAALYIAYATNPSGSNPTSSISEGNEIPASRTFYNIAINHSPGVNINNDLTLKSHASAITLTSGVIKMASGKTLICDDPANAGIAGNDTSYVQGAVALTVGTTAATRTFPIGISGQNRKIVVNGLKASTGNLTVRFVLDTSSATTAGTGITVSGKRKWKATVLSGTLGQYDNIAVDFNPDDAVTSGGVLAFGISTGRAFYGMGSGTNTSTAIACPVGPYTSLRYYALATPIAPTADTGTSFTIIKRSGDKLMKDGKEFRLVGLNAYTLSGIAANGWHMPDEYEMNDVFKTCEQMGVNTVRTLMFSIKGGEANGSLPAHIDTLRTYNDSIFRNFDKVLQLANQYKVRIIVPFIGYADSHGGIEQFAGFRGKTGPEFFTDATLRADYKHFVNYVLNRTNYYTGVKYKDDPAILCWETGNELRDSTPSKVDNWTLDVTAYIKSIDSNHLVMDGKESSVQIFRPHNLSTAQLNNPNVDIITEHYYVNNYGDLCNDARDSCAGRKAFIVGEFSNTNASMHQQLLQAMISNGTSGALMWSLTHHSTNGGFYYKGDPTQQGNPEYRWPGFSATASTQEVAKMNQIRDYSYQVRNVIKPPKPVPPAPYLLPTSSRNHIVWQGSVGAENYILERATDTTGTWTTVDNNVHEDMIPFVSYSDPVVGSGFYYRIKAKNASGTSGVSNIVGPMNAKGRIKSTLAAAGWSFPATWQGGIVPTPVDTVEVIAGSTVQINGADTSATIEVYGTLIGNVNAASLVVNGDLVIKSGGTFSPFYSSSGKPVTVMGNFTNNGQADLSKGGFMLNMSQATGGTTIGGTGTFTTGVIRSLTIDNSNGVMLSTPLSVSYTLALKNGLFTNGSNLTMNDKSYGNGGAPPFCTIQRTQSSSLGSAYTLNTNAALYISYLQNPSGANPNSTITEGNEIPASRAFHNITMNNPNGVQISNDVTLKSSSTAITLTSGIINVATGKVLICNSPSYVGVDGSSTSYVDGAVALTASTTAGTRTFPIGSNGQYRKVVLTNLKSTTGNVTVRFGIEAPAGGTGSGVTLSTARRFKGNITAGTLSEFTGIGIGYGTDDAVSQSTAVIASSTTIGGTYTSIGTGTNTATSVVSPTGSYASLDYYALATPNVMRVGLVGFTAQLEGKKVSLKWSTATETNSRNFVVDYSTNGTDFKPVLAVPSRGNSTTVQQYEAWYSKPGKGINFYRLKEYDIDGKETVFNIQKIAISSTNDLAVSIYPNPVKNGAINMLLHGTHAGQVEVAIKDINGKTIGLHKVNAIEGSNNITLHETLAKGVYIVSVNDGTATKTTRLIAD